MECVLTVTFEIFESVQSTVGKVDSLVLRSGEAASPTAAEQGQTPTVPHLLLLQRGGTGEEKVALQFCFRPFFDADWPKITLLVVCTINMCNCI